MASAGLAAPAHADGGGGVDELGDQLQDRVADGDFSDIRALHAANEEVENRRALEAMSVDEAKAQADAQADAGAVWVDDGEHDLPVELGAEQAASGSLSTYNAAREAWLDATQQFWAYCGGRGDTATMAADRRHANGLMKKALTRKARNLPKDDSRQHFSGAFGEEILRRGAARREREQEQADGDAPEVRMGTLSDHARQALEEARLLDQNGRFVSGDTAASTRNQRRALSTKAASRALAAGMRQNVAKTGKRAAVPSDT